MKGYRNYLNETLLVENSELADLKKHLHDQQMKYAAAQKRKDKHAMDFWNHAIKNTEEEIKYYENENFSSTSASTASGPKRFKGIESHKDFDNYIKKMGFEYEKFSAGEGPSSDDMFTQIRVLDKDENTVGFWQNDPKESYGVVFNSAKEYDKYETDEYEKHQKWIDDEIKAGRNPFQDEENSVLGKRFLDNKGVTYEVTKIKDDMVIAKAVTKSHAGKTEEFGISYVKKMLGMLSDSEREEERIKQARLAEYRSKQKDERPHRNLSGGGFKFLPNKDTYLNNHLRYEKELASLIHDKQLSPKEKKDSSWAMELSRDGINSIKAGKMTDGGWSKLKKAHSYLEQLLNAHE